MLDIFSLFIKALDLNGLGLNDLVIAHYGMALFSVLMEMMKIIDIALVLTSASTGKHYQTQVDVDNHKTKKHSA